jgi:nitrogen fixation protein NifU and related proteins
MVSNEFDLYREHILDHARHRRNWGLISAPDFDHEEDNTLCGDHLHLTLTLDEHQRIRGVGWDGHGCAISQASASLLGEKLIGMTLEQAYHITRDEMLDLIGISLTPNRMKCALLSLKVLIVGIAGVREWEHIEDES